MTVAFREDLLEDYDALRNGAGARDLARDVVAVSGPDALDYLQGQCSQDLIPLAVGGSVDSLILEPDGKLDVLVRVTRTGDDTFVLDTDSGFGSVTVARLERFRLRSKVEISAPEWHCVGVRGALAAPPPHEDDGTLLLAVEWNGWSGFDLLGPEPIALPADARRTDSGAWESCRIESGIPVMGRELDGRTIAAEAELQTRAVSLTKGCFTGQELIARLDARGNRVARHLRGLVVEEYSGEAPTLIGVELRDDAGKPVGSLTSAAACPGVGEIAGLGYVHRSIEPGAALVIADGGGVPLGRATVHKLPLV